MFGTIDSSVHNLDISGVPHTQRHVHHSVIRFAARSSRIRSGATCPASTPGWMTSMVIRQIKDHISFLVLLVTSRKKAFTDCYVSIINQA